VLTLDGPGVYIFLTNGLTVSGSVSFINGANACDVYWRDASSVTINAGSQFVGTIIALTSISMGTGATLEGRAFAQTGSVTLLANTFSNPLCVTPVRERNERSQRPTISGLPNTGGAPIRNTEFPWGLVIVGGITAAALMVERRSSSRKSPSKK
jgi:hypothetical protein